MVAANIVLSKFVAMLILISENSAMMEMLLLVMVVLHYVDLKFVETIS